MPKYHNKKRLKEIIASGKEITSLTNYLILEGYSYEEAKEGLEPFVSSWERSVKHIEKSRTIDLGYSEEFDHDLWARSELYKVLQHASEGEQKIFHHRISQADLRFKNATVTSKIVNNHVDNPDEKLHWWLYRINKF